jgi:hypothetical protein
MREQIQPRPIVEPLPGCDPAIEDWLWALKKARRRTLAVAESGDWATPNV